MVSRRAWTVFAASALLAVSATVFAPEAGAISRAAGPPCAGYLLFNSNQSTCWANAGGISVALYGVYGYSSGNNAGCFNTSSANWGYAKYSSSSFGGTTTVSYIYISSSGSGSNAPCDV